MENDRSGTSDEGNGGRENRGTEIMMEKYRKEGRKLQGERERGQRGESWGGAGLCKGWMQNKDDGLERWREA